MDLHDESEELDLSFEDYIPVLRGRMIAKLREQWTLILARQLAQKLQAEQTRRRQE
ncbi:MULTISPECIES: hypothetical protein [Frankia]|uniref:hypothetical protein n=1 Tax=Frankia TaxID=1854 RepID=UPI0002EA11CB|nr:MULTISPECIES: hypothetical protein [Frankia]